MTEYTKQCANCLNQGKDVIAHPGGIKCNCKVVTTEKKAEKAHRSFPYMYNIMEYVDPTSCPFWRGGN